MSLIKRIKLFIALLKESSYDKLMDLILPILLENKWVIAFLGKYKTIVGFLLIGAYAVLEYAIVMFPNQPWIPSALLIVGLILQALGISHRGVKERRLEAIQERIKC